ncbi:hypothetical protein HZP28_17015 [Elizabethkingia anophelis]|nr:hypothetical protein [Elizabethkingia anophelis]MCT4274435.1 hypothetical protein [Elizabethkingia anophelis]MCT4292044.1 hypothetical protein [Elizabethkingia anophelis]MDV4073404.1 hypothetical protein [Elizabethkingia anophelis]
MMKFKHVFMTEIPQDPEQGILYVSIQYKVVVHLCACGCKNKVVTRLSPKDWELTFDGNGITLYPSIGNWNFKCQSHYWVKNNSIININDKPKVEKRKKKNFFSFFKLF